MTTEGKTLRGVENPYPATNKKPSPATFVIWLIATIVFLGGAIGLAIPAGIQVSYYIDDKIFTDQLKQEIDNPCKEFDDLINACESGGHDSLDDLEPYWVNLLESYESRGMSTSYFHWMHSSYEYKIYAVWSLAENAFFCTQETIDGKHVYAINSEHAGDFEAALLSEIDSTYKDRLYMMYDSRNDALAFSIPSIVCLIVGIVGIFITIKQFKKLKLGRVAYENAVLAYAISEEKQKSEMLLIMEAMQRKIDALEEKATTEPTPQNTTQMPEQQIETPIGATSAQQPATTATSSTNASVYVDSDTTTDTQTEFNQDAPVDSQSENQEGASPRGEAARPDQITIGKAPKNPIKYLKFLVKTPIKTMADIEQMKKNIRPLLYTSIGVLAAPMIVVAITGLSGLSSISFIGLVGVGFCGFLHFVLKKAKEKFEALICNACHTMIATETKEAFREIVSYEIKKENSVVNVHHPESQNGIVSIVKAFGVAGADILVTMKCPNCGKTKTFTYSIAPFKCEKILKNVSATEIGTVKLSLEKAVQTVLDQYMDREKRKEIPYTIHSVNHPNYENRGKAQLNASRIYRDVQITYHRDVEEMIEGFFIHNELNGTIVNTK